MSELTEKEKAEYHQMADAAMQMQLSMEDLTSVTYGYARAFQNEDELKTQINALKEAGASVIYEDLTSLAKREQFYKMKQELQRGDTVIITKLDRVAGSWAEVPELFNQMQNDGIRLRILDMGTIENTSSGRLLQKAAAAFVRYGQDIRMQRAREKKENMGSDYKEGRKKKYGEEQMRHALELLDGSYSYSQVVKMTGISKSTLIRAVREKRQESFER